MAGALAGLVIGIWLIVLITWLCHVAARLAHWLANRPRDVDQLNTLTPRIVTRSDGFAYVAFDRPRQPVHTRAKDPAP